MVDDVPLLIVDGHEVLLDGLVPLEEGGLVLLDDGLVLLDDGPVHEQEADGLGLVCGEELGLVLDELLLGDEVLDLLGGLVLEGEELELDCDDGPDGEDSLFGED